MKIGRNSHLNIKPKQSLGQNFLIDDNIARNIIRELHLKEKDVVVEIGPGQGALTKHLAASVKHLIAVEIDGRVVADLRERFQSDNVTIVHHDFLKLSLADWQKKFHTKLRVVGNIPYHLTSPILFKTFDERDSVKDLTIMVQKEVAKRLTATPNNKDYGILSVLTRFYGSPNCLFNVSPNCFYPKPKVTSTVVRVLMHDIFPHRVNDALFRLIVKTTFGKRRKTLRNGLAFLPYSEEIVEGLIQELNFPLEKRPEQLSVEQFIELTKQINKYITLN